MRKRLYKMLESSFFIRVAFTALIFAVLITATSCRHDKDKNGVNTEVDGNTIFLSSVKVGATLVAVADVMDAGNTNEVAVLLEFASNPSDATLSFSPTLKKYDATTKKGEWMLQVGENTLAIMVKKDSVSREYKLKITKEGLSPTTAPKITSITVGHYKKEGDGIVEVEPNDEKIIEIPVPLEIDGFEYDLKIETDIEGVKIDYNADDVELKTALERNKVKFGKILSPSPKELEKEFSIKISKDGKERNYKIKVIMMTHAAGFFGARLNGKNTTADLETIKKILKYEDVTLNVAGHEAFIIFISRTTPWKTVLYNGKNAKHNSNAYYKGYGRAGIPLRELGSTTDVKVVVSNSEWENGKPKKPWLATEEFAFKIKCNETAADAFIDEVLVNGESITNEKKNPNAFTSLFGSEFAEIECGKSAVVGIKLLKEVEKVSINDIEIKENQLKKEQTNKGTIFIAEVENIAVDETNGKEVTIVVSPKADDTKFYRETTMKFKLVYKVPPKLYPDSLDINEADWYYIPQSFKTSIREGTNPLHTIKTNRLDVRIVFKKKPKKITMKIADAMICEVVDNQIIEVKNNYGTIYEAFLSGAVNDTEKQVTLKFEPDNEGAFSNGEWNFRIKGTNESPKITPKFQRIGSDENLPKESFLDKLATSGAEYLVSGDTAELLISLSKYEKNFLLKEIKVNGVKVTDEEFKFYQKYTISEWRLTKTIDGLTQEGKDFTIKFEAKDGAADSIEWNFKLKSAG